MGASWSFDIEHENGSSRGAVEEAAGTEQICSASGVDFFNLFFDLHLFFNRLDLNASVIKTDPDPVRPRQRADPFARVPRHHLGGGQRADAEDDGAPERKR
jgi:hypothetical protein